MAALDNVRASRVGGPNIEDLLDRTIHPTGVPHLGISLHQTCRYATRFTEFGAIGVYEKAPSAMLANAGTVQIRTTLDTRLHEKAAKIVRNTLARYGAKKRVSEAALVAMRQDGAVISMVGGRSYYRAGQARRQPSSAFKLFVYYAALRQGFTPEDKILDAPVDIHGWQPDSYGQRHYGEVTLADAFADSLNKATVRLRSGSASSR